MAAKALRLPAVRGPVHLGNDTVHLIAVFDGHGGAVTLTVLQKEVGQARPDLYEWLTRDGGKLPVDKGVVPVGGLEEAVAAFDEEQRLCEAGAGTPAGRSGGGPQISLPKRVGSLF